MRRDALEWHRLYCLLDISLTHAFFWLFSHVASPWLPVSISSRRPQQRCFTPHHPAKPGSRAHLPFFFGSLRSGGSEKIVHRRPSSTRVAETLRRQGSRCAEQKGKITSSRDREGTMCRPFHLVASVLRVDRRYYCGGIRRLSKGEIDRCVGGTFGSCCIRTALRRGTRELSRCAFQRTDCTCTRGLAMCSKGLKAVRDYFFFRARARAHASSVGSFFLFVYYYVLPIECVTSFVGSWVSKDDVGDGRFGLPCMRIGLLRIGKVSEHVPLES